MCRSCHFLWRYAYYPSYRSTISLLNSGVGHCLSIHPYTPFPPPPPVQSSPPLLTLVEMVLDRLPVMHSTQFLNASSSPMPFSV